jgi:hypothetical protein
LLASLVLPPALSSSLQAQAALAEVLLPGGARLMRLLGAVKPLNAEANLSGVEILL